MTFHDVPDFCCAAGICCNEAKRRAELARILDAAVPHLNASEAAAVADYIHDNFTLLPKSLGFGPAFHALAEMARDHPYE